MAQDVVGAGSRRRSVSPSDRECGRGESSGPPRCRPPGSTHRKKFGVVVRGHLVMLAAFLEEPKSPPFAAREVVFDIHADDCADAGEAEHHNRDDRPIPQPADRIHVDGIDQLACLIDGENRCLALLNDVFGTANRMRGVDVDGVADHQIVETRGSRQGLLDRRFRATVPNSSI